MIDGNEPSPGTQTGPISKAEPALSQRVVKELPTTDNVLARIESLITEPDKEHRADEIDQFIKERTSELIASSKPTVLSLLTGTSYKGFIHPETRVMRNFIVDAVLINDPAIYNALFDSIRQLKENPAWQNRNMREIAQYALVNALGTYFGNFYGTDGTEEANRAFYMDHSGIDSEDIPISDFRGKQIGVCAEKTAVAQNLLTFMGYNSELIMSTDCKLEPSDNISRDGHAYQIISSESGRFIHDPTNPVIVNNTEGSLYAVIPASYQITEDQYRLIENGGRVEVVHTDLIWNGKEYKKGEGVKRIYGGPKKI